MMLTLFVGLVSSVFIKMDDRLESGIASMERILSLLKKLEESDIKPRKFLKGARVSEIQWLLEEVCIDEAGKLRDVDRLEDAGYHVYPLERDSCGWLLGAVVTKKGEITFG